MEDLENIHRGQIGQQLSLDFLDTAAVTEPVFTQRGSPHESDAFIEGPQGKFKPSVVPQFKGVLRTFNPANVKNVYDFLTQVNRNIPLNEVGLPAYILRADLLDVQYILDLYESCHSFPPTEGRVDGTQELNAYLDSASVGLIYDSGYPAFQSGEAFWKQLPFEPIEAYQAFLSYVQQDGIREVGRMGSFDPQIVREYSIVYYWNWRARSFDMYRLVHHQRIKLQRQLSLEENHYTQAEKILQKLGAYFDSMNLSDGDEETDPNITPEKAVGMMEKLVKIQRISAGLPAMGESKENNGVRQDITPETAMQQLAQNRVKVVDDADEQLDMLESDPDAIVMAQELIIRMQISSRGDNN